MKKYLSIVTALAVITALTGCASAAKDSALNGASASAASKTVPTSPPVSSEKAPTAEAAKDSAEFKGTDIGGHIAETDGDYFEAGDIAVDDAFADTVADEAARFYDHDFSLEPEDGIDIDDWEYIEEPLIPPQAGLLTGGEWNDNAHWADWNALYSSREDWEAYRGTWENKTAHRLAVTVTKGGRPFQGAKVTCPNCTSAVSDNKGMAYLFFDGGIGSPVTVSWDGETATSVNADWVDPNTDNTLTVELEDDAVSPIANKLDLMIMCDTTGSMGDELEYLKEELSDVVTRIKSDNANIPVRVSVNFYRDTEDEYEVREFPFSEDLTEVVNAIGEQSADGGGDFPEAVHTALDSALNHHDWDEDSVKIMFLVLDAPPHDDAQIIDQVNKHVSEFAERGIRIVPVASSGIDKSTEYLLRTMAFTTGGTYTFLTDDSGVGSGHIEATVGAYNVEKLNDMMVRIVNGYLSSESAVYDDFSEQSSSEQTDPVNEQSSTEESGYDPDTQNGGARVNGHADIIHTVMGQDHNIFLNSPEAGELLKWLESLELTEAEELPDVDGGEAYDITFSDGFTTPENWVYIIHGTDEHYLYKGDQLYSVDNPSRPPIKSDYSI